MKHIESRFMARCRPILSSLALILICALGARAGQTQVAVAANFSGAAKEIGAAFEAKTGHSVRFSFGATGQLFTQISQGAPFDAFLAADRARPERAEREGYAVNGTRFTYAVGRIVLYSPEAGLALDGTSLKDSRFHRVAIANPATAPYGAAALAALHTLGLYDAVKPRLVKGTNIAQAFQFIHTGNADIGFVALSQLADMEGGSRWPVPASLHATLAQDAVLLTHGEGNEAATAFLDFLRGPEAGAILKRFGYEAAP